ncbi:hypothetical protein M409DRAFT_26579 [Zasmidium cellare ATCC 36951]|uniref:BTB domain-containing protein n=1 Tax=Zasmidium cellare ATCC 36951 TaxID=1080233 RepID=A0A6A6C7Q4_ZASCE|nr:uncharacterized protein M409DRAFT_26579 [Zasmidium cellare ATCC 36951]KAF2163134.1 hypothetical protein M409DRAFT_26579 [Zasmidium cellare ATCC 36951]
MPRKGGKRPANTQMSEPAPKRFKSSYNKTITVLVGPEEDKFIVHKSTACDNSPFFKAACSQHWVEGQDKVVRLPDTTAKLFETFLHWAYTKDLKMEGVDDSTTADQPRTYDLGSVWGLANYLQTPALRNKVIDRLLQKFDAMPHTAVPRSALNHIWDLSPPDATIRRLLIDLHLTRMSRQMFEAFEDEWPQDLILAAARLHFASEEKRKMLRSPCFEERACYHEAEDGEGEEEGGAELAKAEVD